jgi:hypothetical protein
LLSKGIVALDEVQQQHLKVADLKQTDKVKEQGDNIDPYQFMYQQMVTGGCTLDIPEDTSACDPD